MVKKIFVGIGVFAAMPLLFLPGFIFASNVGGSDNSQNPYTVPPNLITPPPSTTGPITSVAGRTNSVLSLVQQILFWVSVAFWIAAAGFIFYAAYLYLVAGGDAERVKKAHKQLLWAVVAIAVAIMAQGLPLLVGNFLRGQ